MEGDLAIPVDLLAGEPEPAPPAAPNDVKPGNDPNLPGLTLDASAPKRRDAGAVRDGNADDGAPVDGGAQPSVADAGSSELADALLTDNDDGGVGQGGPHDAVGMIGAAGEVQAGPQFVVLMVNMAAIRSHPVGSRMGPLVTAIPQWDDFVGGTGVDPVRDIDWVLINGPSLINTGRDAIIIHYSVPDVVVNKAIVVLSHKYDRGGLFDAGVPGMKAALGHADRYERVFLQPQPHLAACVPPDYATKAARLLRRATLRPPRPNEVMRLKLVHPHGPMPDIPESVTELRLWVVPHNEDGSADVYAEGDTADAATAGDVVVRLRRLTRDINSILVQAATHGLLNGLEFSQDGPTLRLHVTASRDQIEVILMLVAGRLGVTLPMPPPAAKNP